jgi:stage 0 sporulation regulatory protein
MDRDRLKTKLLETINNRREEMIITANKEGYTSESVIKCSQELDILLNKYQQLMLEEEQQVGRFQGLVFSINMWAHTDSYFEQILEKQ